MRPLVMAALNFDFTTALEMSNFGDIQRAQKAFNEDQTKLQNF